MPKEKETPDPATPSVPTATPVSFQDRLLLLRSGLTPSDIAAAAEEGLTIEQMLELGAAMKAGQAQVLAATAGAQTADIAAAMAKANGEVLSLALDRDKQERNFPHISVLNPKGEKDHPRPEIVGEVLWLETRLDKSELEAREIELINRLRPGAFHGGQWQVIDRAPGSNTRSLQVIFPNVEPDDRSNLPPSMVAMLEEMVGDAASPVLVGA
jgi:hypothetical protein